MNRKKAAQAAVRQANLQRAKGAQQLRASGAAGPHGDRRTKRLRTRQARKDKALQDE